VAEMVLSRCVTKPDITGTGCRTPDHVTYSFEFLDDFYTPYKSIKGFFKHVRQKKFTSDETLEQSFDNNNFDLPLTSAGNNSEVVEQDQGSKESWLQRHYRAENHVLNLMVSV